MSLIKELQFNYDASRSAALQMTETRKVKDSLFLRGLQARLERNAIRALRQIEAVEAIGELKVVKEYVAV